MIGFCKSFGLFFVEFLELFQGSSSATSLIFSVQAVSFSISSYIAMAILVDRVSCRSLTVVGGLWFGLGIILSSQARSLPEAIACIGLLGGAGQSLMTGPSLIMLGKYFDKRYGIASGIAICGGSLGQLIFPPMFQYLIDSYGIRGGLLILGGFTLNCMICGALLRPLPGGSGSKRRKLFSNNVKGDNFVQSGEISITCQTEERQEAHQYSTNSLLSISGKQRRADNSLNDNYSDMPSYYWEKTNEYLPDINISPHTEGQCLELIRAKRKDFHLSSGSIYMTPEMFCGSQTFEFNSPEDHVLQDKARTCNSCHCFKTTVIDCSLMRNPLYLLCVVTFIFAYMGVAAQVVFIPPHAEDVGLSSTSIPILISVIGGCDLIGRLLVGFVADTQVIPRYRILLIALILQSVTATLTFLATDFWALVGISVGYGLLGGTLQSLLPVVLVDFFGLQNLSSSIGIMFLFQGSVFCAVNPFLGWSRDATGNYNGTFFMIGGMLLTSGGLLCFVPLFRKWFINKSESVGIVDTDNTQALGEKPTGEV